MRTVFADSFYFLALVNSKDPCHAAASEFSRTYRQKVVTTNWVLMEVGDGLASPINRGLFLGILDELRTSSSIRIENLDDALFDEGVSLFGSRMDKNWSLTDCTSFVTMTPLGLTEALTGDHHFTQAGFVALFRR